MAMAPRVEIPPPSYTQPSAGGLLRSVQVIEHDDNEALRWQGGFTHSPEFCGDAASVWMPCSGDTKPDPAPSSYGADPDFDPFVVIAPYQCATTSPAVKPWSEYQARARLNLERWLSIEIEREFLVGAAARAAASATPYLADPNVHTNLTPVGTAGATRWSLARLQRNLRECLGDAAGVIHASPALVSLWVSEWMVFRGDDGILRDVYGNVVVAGGGYEGLGPIDGGAPTEDTTGQTEWAYATGPIVVHLGPTFFTPDEHADAIIRPVNDVVVRAERVAAVQFDPCCVFAINVALCDDCCDTSPGS